MEKSFLQSSLWQKFQQALGRKTFFIDEIYIYKYNLPFGKSYLYAPGVNIPEDFNFILFWQKIKEIATQEGAIFVKIEPGQELVFDFKEIPVRIVRTKTLQPQDTLTIDVSQNEDELLAKMKQKTRYNIRLAQKHGLKVVSSTSPADIDIFWQLAKETSKRDNFQFHPKEYYQKMLEVLGKEEKIQLLTAYTGRIPIACALFLFYDKIGYYLHGTSSSKYRNLMAPYLLQWQAILEAKKRGCQIYDFWGVAPASAKASAGEARSPSQVSHLESSSHPWEGITRFKQGFAPENKIIHYPKAYIFIIKPFWWKIYKIFKRL